MLLFFWLQDEPLSPEATEALAYRPPIVPMESNAHTAMVGFDAPTGRDFTQVGEERVWQAAQGIPPPPDETRLTLRKAHRDVDFCASLDAANCLEEILKEAENIRQGLEENLELAERYLKITSLPVFSNSLDILFISLVFSVNYTQQLVETSQLLSARAVLDIQEGRIADGLAWMAKDQALYRRIFASKEARIVDKMIAIWQIRQQAMLLGRLMEQDALRGRMEDARALLTPLENPKEHFLEARWWEHVHMLQSVSYMMRATGPGDLSKRMNFVIGQDEEMDYVKKLYIYFGFFLLYKHNMSMNLESELLSHEIALINETPLSRLVSESKILPEKIRERTCAKPADSFICKHWSNYAGEFIVLGSRSLSYFTDFLLRIHDADAVIRLTRAQLEYQLAAKNPQPDSAEIPRILATLGPETFNPYTGKLFEWNPEKG
ncbi:MAG: hypothetical protein LBT71_02560, partial [Azoarcus sp.]|nr:hypothetical protein [Azoarcus sp.]